MCKGRFPLLEAFPVSVSIANTIVLTIIKRTKTLAYCGKREKEKGKREKGKEKREKRAMMSIRA
jgi:hypothetical protein